MLTNADRLAVKAIEDAATSVLTLAEGLEQSELASSRLTKGEIVRQLLIACAAYASLSVEARVTLEELDFGGWAIIELRLREGGESAASASWLAIRAMAPTTLTWIRFYRSQKPELFYSSDREAVEGSASNGGRG